MITLATLAQATKQEVFNHIAEHLLTQKQKAKDGSACVYRTACGLRCAAGSLITADEYITNGVESYEGVAWTTLAKRLKLIPNGSYGLIEALQGVHDMAEVDDWPYELVGVASMYGLSTGAVR